ncbi:MAG TPA: glycosyltransferase [Chitinophagaceae bacterium]|jgi:UDP-N-acetylglucosamine transferase subunit ALG13|nr:glycosyltransferase [Chitinophagaceae bacterium]
MAAKNYMTSLAGKKLLVAPLDWGLGHATRCVPVIRDLLNSHCEVWLAGEGAQEKLLREEFPSLPFLPLKGYRIKYAKTGFTGKILLQVPSILRSIKEENKWLKEQATNYGFEAVVSDNRYGLYHEKIFSVFITHQLFIKSSLGKWSEKILQQWNYKFINRFNECWIPDEQGENNLAGELSHPVKLPLIPTKYIGPLSRFARQPADSFADQKIINEIKDHLLIILSGPEPQRTILENKVVDEIANYPATATIVRGLPGEKDIIPSTNTIHFYNHLSSEELNSEAMKAEFIISRSGYSTIMDIAALQKKSILIPTPGQTEQEYLANHLMKKQFAFCVDQNNFSVLKNVEEARNFGYRL